MLKRRKIPVGALGLTAAALVVVSGTAQGQISGVFGEIIEVRVVNIEVVVTDRSGERVPGLTAEDFRLLVDGEDVTIEYFTEVREGGAVLQAPAGAKAETGRPRDLPSVKPGAAVGTSFLVFIDDYFPIPRDRDRVLERIMAELPRLGPEDRMAVVAFDGKRVEMLSSWSGSVSQLERAFQKAMLRPSHGLQRYAELRSVDYQAFLFAERPYEQRAFDATFELSPHERDYVRRLNGQLERVTLAATATLRSFAAPPGRKVMLLLSGGWPLDPATYAVTSRETPIVDPEADSAAGLFRTLADTANLLGYTLYPVDVPGSGTSLVDAEDSVPPSLAAGLEARLSLPAEELAGTNPALTASELVNVGLREFEIEGSLTLIADETGGRALINSLRDEALPAVISDTRTYYWLGFSPRRKGDDQRHKIRVEVLRPGLEVRSRKGFLDYSRQREVSMMVESSLLFGNPPSTQPLTVRVGKPRRAGANRMLVPLTLAIPMNVVTMLPYRGQYVGQLELRVASLNTDGARSDMPVIPVQLSGKAPPPEGSYSSYETSLKLRRERQQLVVAIYDPPSGNILSTTVEIAP